MIKVLINTKEIRKRRIDKELSQIQLAEMIQVNNSYLCEIENGHVIPSLALMANIACALGCTIDELLIKETENE